MGLRRRVAMVTAAVMAGAFLQAAATPDVSADDARGRQTTQVSPAVKPVAGHTAKARPRKVMKGPRTPQATPRAHWPQSVTETVALSQPSLDKALRPAGAEKLPLTFVPARGASKTPLAGSVTVRTTSQSAARRAGVDGLLLSLRPTDTSGTTPVGVRLDYSAFAESFGGGYGSRLEFAQLPSCALTSPGKQQCRTAKPLEAVNDTERQTLTAGRVVMQDGESTVLAVVAAEDDSKTDYKATPLSPSATWSTNLNTGDFAWSYDMPAPSVPGDFAPKVALDYSSGAIDGRTSNTNNQSSWVGDGFDLSPGFIERRYKPCADDGVEHEDGAKPGDECWAYDNAYLTFNGKGGELVPAGTQHSGSCSDDDGTRVTHLASTDARQRRQRRRVLAGDHTGRHPLLLRLQPAARLRDGKETTDSTWTVPVFGDDAASPATQPRSRTPGVSRAGAGTSTTSSTPTATPSPTTTTRRRTPTAAT